MQAIKLIVDTGPIGELTARLLAFGGLSERPIELVNLFRSVLSGPSAFHAESLPTGRAGDHWIVLQPCESLLKLMAALRAFQGNLDLVGKAHSILLRS